MSQDSPKTLNLRVLLTVFGSLAGISLLSTIIGLVSNMAMASIYGTSGEFESFLVASSVPQLMANFLLCSGLSIVLIPKYIKIKNSCGESEAWAFVQSFAFWLFLLGLVMMLAGFFLAPHIVSFYVPGMALKFKHLSVMLTRLLMIMIPVLFFSTLTQSLLNAESVFIFPALLGALIGLVNLLIILLFGKTMHVWALTMGMLINVFFPVCLVLKYKKFFGKLWSSPFHLFHPRLLEGFVPLFMMSIIAMANQVNFMSNRFFASWLGTGKIAIYDYATRMVSVLIGIFCQSLSRPFYTQYARVAAEQSRNPLRSEFLRGLRFLSLFFLPIVFIILILRVPVIELIYARGQFSHRDTLETGSVLLYLCPALVFWGLSQVIVSALYALQKIALIASLTVIGVTIEIGLDFCLVGPMGLQGLATASSIGAVYGTIVCLWFLRKHFGNLDFPNLIVFYGKLAVALCVCGAAAWILGNWMGVFSGTKGIFQILRLGSVSVVALAVYAVIVSLLNVEEMVWFKSLFVNRGRMS